MKLKVIDSDGHIEGWFVALCTTTITFTLPVVAFFGGEQFQYALLNIEGYLKVVYPLSFGSWLAYKAVQGKIK